MSTGNQQPAPDNLDRATEALRYVPVSEKPPQRFRTAVIEALQTQISVLDMIRLQYRRQRMIRIARYSGLVAALLLLVIGASIIWLWDRDASPAFAQVAENVKKATSLVFVNDVSSEPRPGRKAIYQNKHYVQGKLYRSESFRVGDDSTVVLTDVTIGDTQAKQELQITYKSKTAVKHLLTDATANFIQSAPESLGRLADSDAEYLDEEQLNGRKTLVYKVKKFEVQPGRDLKDTETVKVWIDSESHLPVQVLIETWLPGNARIPPIINRQVMSNFKWNEPIDPKLFSMEAPEGFEVVNNQPVSTEPKK
jgi:hypothetical protein